jgi:hypothetical protein
LFALLTQYPGVKQAGEAKENCPYVGGRSLAKYFDSLPRNATSDEIIVGGCIDIENNVNIHRILRHPNTFYLVRSSKPIPLFLLTIFSLVFRS